MANSLYIKFNQIGIPVAYRLNEKPFLSKYFYYDGEKYYKLELTNQELDAFSANPEVNFQEIVYNYTLNQSYEEETYEITENDGSGKPNIVTKPYRADTSTITKLDTEDADLRREDMQKQVQVANLAKKSTDKLVTEYNKAQLVILQDSKTFYFPIQGKIYEQFKEKLNDGQNLGISKLTYPGQDGKAYSASWAYVAMNEIFAIVNPLSNTNYDLQVAYLQDIQSHATNLDIEALENMVFTFADQLILDLDNLFDSVADKIANKDSEILARYVDKPGALANFLSWKSNLAINDNRYVLFTPIV